MPPHVALPVLSLAVASIAAASVPMGLAAQDEGTVEFTADVGFVNAAGNTDVTTLNLGEELIAGLGAWGIKQTFGVVYGRTDGEVSASLWRAGLRGDRDLTSRISLYVLGAFDRNTFSGISRRFEEGAGVVFTALDTETDRLEFEAGGGLTQQRSTEDESTSFTSARAAATYRRNIGGESHAQLSAEVLPNLEDSEDLRVNTVAELVAPISTSMAMKLSYVVRYDNLPQPDFETTDRVLSAGLQFSF